MVAKVNMRKWWLVGFLVSTFILLVTITTLPSKIVSKINALHRPFLTGSYWNAQQMVNRCMNTSSEDNIGAQHDMELTIRMPVNKKMVGRLMCDLLRSAVLFWNCSYGTLHLILDEGDRKDVSFVQTLHTAGLPFKFRFTYEKEPANKDELKRIANGLGKSYGYIIQLYSSFLMDLYTNASVIAWTDTDTIFTQPVIRRSIMRNGKLIAKGMNSFSQFHWISYWDRTTVNALGLPMVSDFMTYFPVYVYPSTIRNCREYIMKRHNAVNQSFELVFAKITNTFISPVSIIMSYAYYFERERYDWHIDIGAPIETLERYNKLRLPNHPLTRNDISPELHQTVHTGYYKSLINPLQQAICYTQIAVGVTDVRFCNQFLNTHNDQLLEFGKNPAQNHLKTWCSGAGRKTCDDLILQQYSQVAELYRMKLLSFDTRLIKLVEDVSTTKFGITCPSISYTMFKVN